MKIRKSAFEDINNLMLIFDEARKTIAKLGINQWQDGYPSSKVIFADIEKSQSYCVENGENVVGTFALISNGEPTYDIIYNGTWQSGNENHSYVAIHRVAISVSSRGSGISGEIINFASQFAKSLKRKSLRIDTHEGNLVMRRMLEKNGFSYCGVVHLENDEQRAAYEKML